MKLPSHFLLLATMTACSSHIITQTVEYRLGPLMMKGFVAHGHLGSGKSPAVMIAPEWSGLNDYARRRARQLAELGYIAFAIDPYGEGKEAASPGEAAQLSGRLRNDPATLRARMSAALEYLKSRADVDTARIAVIGYCFGGTCALELARSGAHISGVVSFHGGLSALMPARPDDINAPILVLHGADDPNVPPAQVEAFKEEMKSAGATIEFVAYPGAVHGFTNPKNGNDNSRGVAYNEEADRESWEKMNEFLSVIFRKQ